MIKFSFHLITLNNKFTTDEEEIEYSFKSHGGRLLVLYMLITFFINNYNNISYSFWKNFGIGIIIAIVWDIVTAGLYLLKMNYIDSELPIT